MIVEKTIIFENIRMKNIYVRIAVVHIRKNVQVNNKHVARASMRLKRASNPNFKLGNTTIMCVPKIRVRQTIVKHT
jgi:hypothetical protein